MMIGSMIWKTVNEVAEGAFDKFTTKDQNLWAKSQQIDGNNKIIKEQNIKHIHNTK